MSTNSLTSLLPTEISVLRYQPLLVFHIEVKPPSVIGATPGYDRRVGEIAGGRFEGERLRGKILSGGSDWQSLRSDGTTTLNVLDRHDLSRYAPRPKRGHGAARAR